MALKWVLNVGSTRGGRAPLGKQMGPPEEIAAGQEDHFFGRTRSPLFSHKDP